MDERGMPDFMQGAQVMTADEYAQSSGAPVNQPVPAPAPAPPPQSAISSAAPWSDGAAGVAADVYADPAAARMWLMQYQERDTACRLLSQQAAGAALNPEEARELRKVLASLITTLS
jgi:hypothetical protein